jgi:hypothetical protein
VKEGGCVEKRRVFLGFSLVFGITLFSYLDGVVGLAISQRVYRRRLAFRRERKGETRIFLAREDWRNATTTAQRKLVERPVCTALNQHYPVRPHISQYTLQREVARSRIGPSSRRLTLFLFFPLASRSSRRANDEHQSTPTPPLNLLPVQAAPSVLSHLLFLWLSPLLPFTHNKTSRSVLFSPRVIVRSHRSRPSSASSLTVGRALSAFRQRWHPSLVPQPTGECKGSTRRVSETG